jgi:hypothetical protein
MAAEAEAAREARAKVSVARKQQRAPSVIPAKQRPPKAFYEYGWDLHAE